MRVSWLFVGLLGAAIAQSMACSGQKAADDEAAGSAGVSDTVGGSSGTNRSAGGSAGFDRTTGGASGAATAGQTNGAGARGGAGGSGAGSGDAAGEAGGSGLPSGCDALEVVYCATPFTLCERVGITSTQCMHPQTICGDGCCAGTCVSTAGYPSGEGGGAQPVGCCPRDTYECDYDYRRPEDFALPTACPVGTLCTELGCCPAGRTCVTCDDAGMPPGACQCAYQGAEECNGRDDDCNGRVDDGTDAVCGAAYRCENGACVCNPENLCDGRCTDFTTDDDCGGCGNQCTGGTSCVDGECRCPADIETDPNNCGSCGHLCPAGAACEQGECACPHGELDCGSGCQNVTDDPEHCGGCDAACVSTAQCVDGECACPGTDGKLCGDTCRDLAIDAENCGECGHACEPTQACKDGSCQCRGFTCFFPQFGGGCTCTNDCVSVAYELYCPGSTCQCKQDGELTATTSGSCNLATWTNSCGFPP